MPSKDDELGGLKGPWKAMVTRCTRPNAWQFRYYGGRGVRICERWLSFDNFATDMAPRPSGTTLDRIDVNGDYRPDNCRWATKVEQRRNRSDVRPLTVNGRTMLIADWEKEKGLGKFVVTRRLRRGWSVEEAVGERPRTLKRRHPIVLNGEKMSLSEAARRHGLDVKSVSQRMRRGWSLNAALGLDGDHGS